jgi:flagellar biosynthesis/type III secretory pathway chaperone
LEILNESGHQLGELRKQVQDLVTFFGDILNEVKVTVEGDVQKDLLRPIDNKLTYDKNGVCNGINMKTKAKKVRTAYASMLTSITHHGH